MVRLLCKLLADKPALLDDVFLDLGGDELIGSGGGGGGGNIPHSSSWSGVITKRLRLCNDPVVFGHCCI